MAKKRGRKIGQSGFANCWNNLNNSWFRQFCNNNTNKKSKRIIAPIVLLVIGAILALAGGLRKW